MSDFMDGVNKWAIDNPLGAKVLEQQSRIEHLERELAEYKDVLAWHEAQLAAEKALADRLYKSSRIYRGRAGAQGNEEFLDSNAAYRKARGL